MTTSALGEGVAQVGEGSGGAADPLGDRAGPVVVAVGDDDGAGAGARDGRRGEGTHAPGADDEHRQVAEAAELGLGAGQPRLHERAAHEVDAGLGVDALRDAQGLLEHAVERGSDVAVPLRAGERAAHLTEDLRLADGHRVEPAPRR